MGDSATEDKLEEIELQPSGLETIDRAMLRFINVELDLHLSSNEGFKKVPVLWTTTERAYQVKENEELRDKHGTLILPLITITRTSVSKEPGYKAIPYAHMYPNQDAKGGTITVARQINQKKTAEFQNAEANKRYGVNGQVRSRRYNSKENPAGPQKIVYDTITMPLPTWVKVNYEIALRTEYQQQMNDLQRPFFTISGNSRMPQRITAQGHAYEAFIDGSFTDNSNQTNLGMEQRNYETIINIEVLGYFIGEGENQKTPAIVKRQNAVEFKFGREHAVVGDIPESRGDGKKGWYRE